MNNAIKVAGGIWNEGIIGCKIEGGQSVWVGLCDRKTRRGQGYGVGGLQAMQPECNIPPMHELGSG